MCISIECMREYEVYSQMLIEVEARCRTRSSPDKDDGQRYKWPSTLFDYALT